MKSNDLANRIATNIKRKRTKISKEQLQEHFDNIKDGLDVPSSNIWMMKPTSGMTLGLENML